MSRDFVVTVLGVTLALGSYNVLRVLHRRKVVFDFVDEEVTLYDYLRLRL